MNIPLDSIPISPPTLIRNLPDFSVHSHFVIIFSWPHFPYAMSGDWEKCSSVDSQGQRDIWELPLNELSSKGILRPIMGSRVPMPLYKTDGRCHLTSWFHCIILGWSCYLILTYFSLGNNIRKSLGLIDLKENLVIRKNWKLKGKDYLICRYSLHLLKIPMHSQAATLKKKLEVLEMASKSKLSFVPWVLKLL